MKVTIAGKELKIYWRYLRGNYDGSVTTYCYIVDDDDVLSAGGATCPDENRFCKEAERKTTLTDAIAGFQYEYVADDGIHKRNLSQPQRKQIWQAYFDRKPKKDKEQTCEDKDSDTPSKPLGISWEQLGNAFGYNGDPRRKRK